MNRGLLDVSAKRLFAVNNPVIITVENIPATLTQFSLSFHPHGTKGERVISCATQYYIEKEDNDAVTVGELLRLIDGMNIRKITSTQYVFVSVPHEKELGARLVHYVPKDGDEVKASMLMPDLVTKTIIVEKNVVTLKNNEVVQFERNYFARLDDRDTMAFWFSHN